MTEEEVYVFLQREVALLHGKQEQDVRVEASSKLRTDLEIDSLSLIELTIMVEREFGLTVEDDELEGLETAGDFAALLQRLSEVGAKA